MSLLGYTPEERVDFYINIGLYSKEERQIRIAELYKGASEILAGTLNEYTGISNANMHLYRKDPLYERI